MKIIWFLFLWTILQISTKQTVIVSETTTANDAHSLPKREDDYLMQNFLFNGIEKIDEYNMRFKRQDDNATSPQKKNGEDKTLNWTSYLLLFLIVTLVVMLLLILYYMLKYLTTKPSPLCCPTPMSPCCTCSRF